MIYKAYVEQEEAGCDFTIGCGKLIIDLKSTNKKDALIELEKILKEKFFKSDNLESVTLYEIVTAVKVEIPYYSYDKMTEEEREEELKEYKKLRRKYYKKNVTFDDLKDIKREIRENKEELEEELEEFKELKLKELKKEEE